MRSNEPILDHGKLFAQFADILDQIERGALVLRTVGSSFRHQSDNSESAER